VADIELSRPSPRRPSISLLTRRPTQDRSLTFHDLSDEPVSDDDGRQQCAFGPQALGRDCCSARLVMDLPWITCSLRQSRPAFPQVRGLARPCGPSPATRTSDPAQAGHCTVHLASAAGAAARMCACKTQRPAMPLFRALPSVARKRDMTHPSAGAGISS
jgi:hypothetical protein